ncbi:MAG: ice-binding family protein [Pseudomonadota bacterium]|nr:ice-binding family protein [Pseudomonadota bacterium]
MAAIPPVTGVALNTKVSATFSRSMAPATFTNATFTLACPSTAPLTGVVTYDAASRTATFAPAAPLPPSTLCVATVSRSVTDSAGVPLAADFVWRFNTGTTADVTPPTVTLTVPADTATGVAPNTLVSATFSEDMAPATLSGTSFTLQNTTLATAVAGTVSYSVAARTATFTPTAGPLPSSTRFTSTVTTAVTDLAGNHLASNFVWTFTTGATADTTPPTVTTVTPPDGSTGLCLSKTVTATFSEAMDPATLSTTTFFVSNGAVVVPGTVVYDAVNKVATFSAAGATGFPANTSLVATVVGGAAGVKDLAGNPLATNRTWGFTTGTQPCATGVDLGSAALFGSFGGGAGVTNQGINTVIQARIGTTAACTLITGFHDATNVYTETPLNVGLVSGGVFCAPPAPGTAVSAATATQARADALAAYNALAAMPPGSDPGAGQLGGLVLAPGVYTSAGGTFGITNGNLTLDAKGDPNAVWVFQMAASLTVGTPALPRSVLVINGGQAKNVYWQVGSAARIEDRSVMVGTIIAPAGVTISTAGQTAQTTLTGRALGLTASVTVVNTTIVAP